MTRARPFYFDELRSAPPRVVEEIAAAPSFSDAELSQARAEGVIEGRRLALESIAADEAASLARIATALETAVGAVEREAERTRDETIAVARVFLDEYCATIAADREIEIAQDLLRRLTENSEDRRAAVLVVSAKSFDRLEARFSAAIAGSRVADFVSLEFDHALAPGEARLEWRGGDVRRGRAEFAAAIAALFDPHSQREAQS
jgi:hypothetical protein